MGKKSQPKVALIILDGWGYREEPTNNAIAQAKTPNFDKLWKNYPRAVLQAAGEPVGLPAGQVGTSEANHMAIGSGRVVFQNLAKINKAIKDDSISENDAILQALEHVKKNNSTLHLKGLVSDGGVHSHQEHFYALLSLAKKVGVQKVLIHVFTDGRDTPPKDALKYVRELQNFIDKLDLGKIASVTGRYWAMDRARNTDRTEKAFVTLTQRKGRKYKSALAAVEDAYNKNETDEFIEPSIIEVGPGEEGCISSNDALIFVNFRADRMVQLTEMFLQSDIENLYYMSMTQCREEFDCQIAFKPEEVNNTLGEILSQAGLKQLRVTETEKFNHLTYFLNCEKLEPLEGEDRILLDTYSDIKTHDERPQMRALDIAQEVVQSIENDTHEAIFANICNGDIVGHTAKVKPLIKAVETVDEAVGMIVEMGLKKNYQIMITADHGNAEEFLNSKTGEPITAHTVNPVPFILANNQHSKFKRTKGSLRDIAPTILKILDIPQPEEMTGTSLV